MAQQQQNQQTDEEQPASRKKVRTLDTTSFATLPQQSQVFSDLLSRVSQFLPQIKAANEDFWNPSLAAGRTDHVKTIIDSDLVVLNTVHGNDSDQEDDGDSVNDDDDHGSDGDNRSMVQQEQTIPSKSHQAADNGAEKGTADADKETNSRSDHDDVDGNDEGTTTTTAVPTIELNFAVGRMDENPTIAWLAAKDTSNDDDDDDDDNVVEDAVLGDTMIGTHRIIKDILVAGGSKQVTATTTTKKRPRGPLITEVEHYEKRA